jgi:hypothetical protein
MNFVEGAFFQSAMRTLQQSSVPRPASCGRFSIEYNLLMSYNQSAKKKCLIELKNKISKHVKRGNRYDGINEAVSFKRNLQCSR